MIFWPERIIRARTLCRHLRWGYFFYLIVLFTKLSGFRVAWHGVLTLICPPTQTEGLGSLPPLKERGIGRVGHPLLAPSHHRWDAPLGQGAGPSVGGKEQVPYGRGRGPTVRRTGEHAPLNNGFAFVYGVFSTFGQQNVIP